MSAKLEKLSTLQEQLVKCYETAHYNLEGFRWQRELKVMGGFTEAYFQKLWDKEERRLTEHRDFFDVLCAVISVHPQRLLQVTRSIPNRGPELARALEAAGVK